MTSTLSQSGPRVVSAYRTLRQQILRGDFQAGDALPPQRQLCRDLGISVVTLGRAIACLAEENLVEPRPGSGVYVQHAAQPLADSGIISYMYMREGEDLTRIQQAALSQGHLLSVFSQCQNQWNPNAERQFLQRVKEQRHRALLAFCSPTEPRNDDLLQELVVAGVRVLHIEHYRETLPDQPFLLPDFERAGHAAVVNLLLAGYSRVYFLSSAPPGKQPAPYCQLLERGIRRALADHGAHSLEESWLEYPLGENAEAIQALAASLPSNIGIIAYSPLPGQELVEALRAQCRAVPAEVGVLAIDVSGSVYAPDVDSMDFNRDSLMERAIGYVSAADWEEPRELIAPTWIKQGTVA